MEGTLFPLCEQEQFLLCAMIVLFKTFVKLVRSTLQLKALSGLVTGYVNNSVPLIEL